MWSENAFRRSPGTAQTKHPPFHGDPDFHPQPGGGHESAAARNRGSRLSSRSWQERRGSQGLGETPAPLQPPRVEGAAETCLPPLFPGGVLDLHPSIPHPGQGSLEGEPPIFIIPAPEPPVPCALQPQRHGSRVAARAPSAAPSPLPCPASPLPSSSPAAVLAALSPARGSDWSNRLSLPRKRRDQRQSLGRPGERGTHPPSQPRPWPPAFPAESPAWPVAAPPGPASVGTFRRPYSAGHPVILFLAPESPPSSPLTPPLATPGWPLRPPVPPPPVAPLCLLSPLLFF